MEEKYHTNWCGGTYKILSNKEVEERGRIWKIVGGILIVLGIIFIFQKNDEMAVLGIIFFMLGFSSLVFGFRLKEVNSTLREKHRIKEELRVAQLKALERGNVNIDLKGKMRKLK